MKFYIEASWLKIKAYNLTAIFNDHYNVIFYKNGEIHSNKNAAYINYSGFKEFRLNGIYYGCEEHFNKKSWRKFVKLKAFL